MNRLAMLLCTAALLAVLGPPAAAAEDDDGPHGPMEVQLSRTELPLSSIRTISVGSYMRSASLSSTPKGYHTMFQGIPGVRSYRPQVRFDGAKPVRFLHKGWDRATCKMYWQPEGKDPVELPRMKGSIHPYYLSFGPVRVPGYSLMSVHFYFPTRNVEAWKKRNVRILYLVPQECMTGELAFHGKKLKLALFDRNFNNRYTDLCKSHRMEGDWILVDRNGDGKFSLHSRSVEVRGVTRSVQLGGLWWKLRYEDGRLFLDPTGVETFRLRVEGVGKACQITGWSHVGGDISGILDAEGCIEIPRGPYRLYSYAWKEGDWRISAAVSRLGVKKPPAEGDEAAVQLGPTLRGELTKYRNRRETGYSFRLLGRAGETVSIYNGKKRSQPVFVVRGPDGKEVFRGIKRFG